VAEGCRSVPMSPAIEGDSVGVRLAKPPSTKVRVITQDLGLGVFPPSVSRKFFFFFKVNIFFI